MQALKALVIFLGGLILVSMGLLGWGFYSKFGDRRLTSEGPATVPPSATPATTISPFPPLAPAPANTFGEVRLPLPPECVVEEVIPADERLFLRTGPSGVCERIVVVETASGRWLGSLLIRP